VADPSSNLSHRIPIGISLSGIVALGIFILTYEPGFAEHEYVAEEFAELKARIEAIDESGSSAFRSLEKEVSAFEQRLTDRTENRFTSIDWSREDRRLTEYNERNDLAIISLYERVEKLEDDIRSLKWKELSPGLENLPSMYPDYSQESSSSEARIVECDSLELDISTWDQDCTYTGQSQLKSRFTPQCGRSLNLNNKLYKPKTVELYSPMEY
jgi:hypothetical protein